MDKKREGSNSRDVVMKESKRTDAEKLQDAVGLVKDEYIEEAAASENAGADLAASENAGADPAVRDETREAPAGNSWISMAMGRERQKKIKDEKESGNKTLRGVSILVACVLLVSIFIIPKAFPGLLQTAKTDESLEEAPAPDSTESTTEDSYESVAGDSAASAPGYSSDSSASAPSDSSSSAPTEVTDESYEDATVEEKEAGTEAETDEVIIDEPIDMPIEQVQGQAFRLTAAEWNDNDNWPFFMNLVNSQTIEFPVYGLNPRNRIKVTVTENGIPAAGQRVELLANSPQDVWTTETDKNGVCYLFFRDGAELQAVAAGGEEFPIELVDANNSGQGNAVSGYTVRDMEIDIVSDDSYPSGTQVMFIVDTTGSMADELAYLQQDFAAIAEDTWDERIEYSVNFYRDQGDEYITKTNGFTKNLASIQNQLNSEYAAGGGDHPEAVADILMETIVDNQDWDSSKNKVAFLIFDAPPHDGTEQQIQAVAMTAAERGIHIVPVVASNADRATELFGRALAIMTNGTYVFLTDDSGIGNPHLEPIVGDYQVELLHDVIVRIINEYKAD